MSLRFVSYQLKLIHWLRPVRNPVIILLSRLRRRSICYICGRDEYNITLAVRLHAQASPGLSATPCVFKEIQKIPGIVVRTARFIIGITYCDLFLRSQIPPTQRLLHAYYASAVIIANETLYAMWHMYPSLNRLTTQSHQCLLSGIVFPGFEYGNRNAPTVRCFLNLHKIVMFLALKIATSSLVNTSVSRSVFLFL